MRLVIPRSDSVLLRSEKDRIIIDTSAAAINDRYLDRQEVARRLNKTIRTVDLYRRLRGEARLQSEKYHNRIVVKESELKRWTNWINNQKDFFLMENLDGSTSCLRPRQRRRRFMAQQLRVIPVQPFT